MSMTWVTYSSGVAVAAGVATVESMVSCGCGISMGGVDCITWVVNMAELQVM